MVPNMAAIFRHTRLETTMDYGRFGSQIRYTVDEKEQQQCNTSQCLITSLLHVFFDHHASNWRHLELIVHKHFTDLNMLHYFLPVGVLGTGGCGTSGNGFLYVNGLTSVKVLRNETNGEGI